MTSQTWRQVDQLKGFEDFVQTDGCKCFPPLAEPSCPVHGYKRSGGVAHVDFNLDPAAGITIVHKYECLRFAVMKLVADTLKKVPSVALGWDKGRLDEINALCK